MIHHGDCLEVMATFDAESIDAIVTDPPYGLGFMGKAWDEFDADPVEKSWSAKGRNQTAKAGEYGTTGTGFRKPNPRCGRCGRAINGRDTDKGFKVCHCEEPLRVPLPNRDAQRYQAWCEQWAAEAWRVAKPGAHLLAFGGTRTYHRLASAIEDAGWEIRDTLVWAYASGFPKSLDVSKAIDKAAGAEREVVGDKLDRPGYHLNGHDGGEAFGHGLSSSTPETRAAAAAITAPATPDAEKWQGWGTALKPAWEPIVLARKPLRGTVAANVLAHGTGALNIDGTRIGTEPSGWNGLTSAVDARTSYGMRGTGEPTSAVGRWPANVILTDPIFDGDTPGVVGGGEATTGFRAAGMDRRDDEGAWRFRGGTGGGDSGTYSRFFLIPKADRSDREPILGGHGLAEGPRVLNSGSSGRTQVDGEWVETHSEPRRRANSHPTVKPTELMRHLVRLITPPGGTVLDPFLGSGTTGLAAELEGFPWIGIEREAEYVAISEARLNGTQRGLGLVG